MTQPDLFHDPSGTIESAIFRCKQRDRFEGGGRASEQAWDLFLEYHKEHPKIFTEFRRYTNVLIKAGVKHFGSMDIIGKIRWESAYMSPNENEYKVCNTAHPFYARVFMEFEAQHQGFFEIKTRPLTGIVKATKEVSDAEA